jgi:hypothetical protein
MICPSLDPVTVQERYTPGMIYRLLSDWPAWNKKLESWRGNSE